MILLTCHLGTFCHRRSKYKVIQLLVACVEDIILRAFPPLVTIVYEYNLLTNLHHRVHIVSVDDGGNVILLGDVAN